MQRAAALRTAVTSKLSGSGFALKLRYVVNCSVLQRRQVLLDRVLRRQDVEEAVTGKRAQFLPQTWICSSSSSWHTDLSIVLWKHLPGLTAKHCKHMIQQPAGLTPSSTYRTDVRVCLCASPSLNTPVLKTISTWPSFCTHAKLSPLPAAASPCRECKAVHITGTAAANAIGLLNLSTGSQYPSVPGPPPPPPSPDRIPAGEC